MFSFIFTCPDLPQKNLLSLHSAFFFSSWHSVLKLYVFSFDIIIFQRSPEITQAAALLGCTRAIHGPDFLDCYPRAWKAAQQNWLWLWSAKLEYGHALFSPYEWMAVNHPAHTGEMPQALASPSQLSLLARLLASFLLSLPPKWPSCT